MGAEIRYTLLGKPYAWKRTSDMHLANGRRVHATPAEMRHAQAAHRWHALSVRPRGWVETGAFEIEVIAYEHPSQRGDSDNYGKLVKDALQKVIYRNDRSVVRDVFERRVDRDRPRTEVVVRRRSDHAAQVAAESTQ
jgi:Holliday junction resolvase RusA-like endonuclease